MIVLSLHMIDPNRENQKSKRVRQMVLEGFKPLRANILGTLLGTHDS